MSEPKHIWTPEKGVEYEDFGKCIFVTDLFVTFSKLYPPAACVAQQMWDNGWEVYYSPVQFQYDPRLDTSKHFIVTYKRRTA